MGFGGFGIVVPPNVASEVSQLAVRSGVVASERQRDFVIK
jgi:hypothetical protein